MAFSLANDPKFFQSVILYEVNNWTPIDRVCENLRKLIREKEVLEENIKLDSKISSFLSELSVESITKFMKDMDMKDAGDIQKDEKFIESVILYEILIGEKDKDKVYKKMFRRIGSDLIPELSVESITTSVKDMDVKDADFIQKDQKFIRSVIFYETHLREEKERIYKKLLRRIGSDVIDYPVFSHWFDQFQNGNHDNFPKSPTFSDLPMDAIGIVEEKMDLKEHSEPKPVQLFNMASDNIEKQFSKMDLMDSSKTEPPSLCDMPNEIIDEITGKLDFMDRLVVRKVSRYFRDMIDKKKPEVQKLDVRFSGEYSLLNYKNSIDNKVTYTKGGTLLYSRVYYSCVVGYSGRAHMIRGGDHMELAINDLASVMKNPKLRLNRLKVEFAPNLDEFTVEKCSTNLKSIFEPLHHQIHTTYVVIISKLPEPAMSILPFVKPGTLEHISLLADEDCDRLATVEIPREIVELEQWKQAKFLNARGFLLSIEHVLHFNYFCIDVQSISVQDVIKIRDVLLKSPSFKFADIHTPLVFNVDDMKRIFTSDIPRNPFASISYKVPDSDNVFQVCIYPHCIKIELLDYFTFMSLC